MHYGYYSNGTYVFNIHIFSPVEKCYKRWLGSQMYVYTKNYQNYKDKDSSPNSSSWTQWSQKCTTEEKEEAEI